MTADLRAEVERLEEVLRQIRDTEWLGEDHDGNDKAAEVMRSLARRALEREVAA